jgi:phosphoglycolate phosphatase-like HAD superfamily hydrolase
MILLLDLDDTLSDAVWRETLKDDWDFYHSQSPNDKPVAEVVATIRALFFAGWRIHVITARPERFREITLRWLIRYSIPVERVLMRADNDKRRSPDVKLDLVLNNFAGVPRKNMIAFDDREDVCQAYRSAGIVAFQIYRNVNHVQA